MGLPITKISEPKFTASIGFAALFWSSLFILSSLIPGVIKIKLLGRYLRILGMSGAAHTMPSRPLYATFIASFFTQSSIEPCRPTSVIKF